MCWDSVPKEWTVFDAKTLIRVESERLKTRVENKNRGLTAKNAEKQIVRGGVTRSFFCSGIFLGFENRADTAVFPKTAVCGNRRPKSAVLRLLNRNRVFQKCCLGFCGFDCRLLIVRKKKVREKVL